jgi:hypothetical protein
LTGVNRNDDENDIATPIGIGNGVASGWTDSQRARWRGVVKGPISYPTLPARLTSIAALGVQLRGQLKADEVLAQCRAEMHSAPKPHGEDGHAAFAWRATRSQCSRLIAISLH